MTAKKIVVITGSPRAGETVKVVRAVERRLRSFEDVEFTHVMLKDRRLGPCRGCFVCLFKGEEFCPLKDDRDELLSLLDSADGVIFATPNYSLQVTAVMKNFLDRFAFVFHRPRFFGKAFIGVVTQGVYGGEKILKYLEELGRFWGFNVAPGVSLTTVPGRRPAGEERAIEKGVERAARSLYRALNGPRLPRPPLKHLFIFRLARTSHRIGTDPSSRDYRYFNERGWLSESPYFYPVRLDPFSRLVGSLADRLAEHLALKKRKALAVEKPASPA